MSMWRGDSMGVGGRHKHPESALYKEPQDRPAPSSKPAMEIFKIFEMEISIFSSLEALRAQTSSWRAFGLLTWSFKPFGRSGHMTQASVIGKCVSRWIVC